MRAPLLVVAVLVVAGASGRAAATEQRAADAARRLLCLAAIEERADLESRYADASPDERRRQAFFVARRRSGLERQGAWDACSEREHELIEHDYGAWTEDDRSAGTWRIEAMNAIAWALGLLDALPPFDRFVDPQAVWDLLRIGDQGRAFIARAQLRPAAELRAALGQAILWHRRARAAEALHAKTPHHRWTLYRRIALAAAEGARQGWFVPRAHDFPAGDGRYDELDAAARERLAQIALERHRAFSWLCSNGSEWERLDVSVLP